MKFTRARIIWISLIIILLIFITRFLIFSFSLNSIKPILEDELSWLFDMEVSIEGDIKASLVPNISINIKNVRLEDTKDLVITIERAELQVPLTTIIGSEVQIRGLRLRNPVVTIVNRSVDTAIPSEEPYEGSDSLNWEVDLLDVKVSNGIFHYYDKNYSDTVIFHGINIASESIFANGSTDTLDIGDILVIADLRIDHARINDLKLDDIALDIDVRDRKFTFSHRSQGYVGKNHEGVAVADFSSDVPRYSIEHKLLDFKIERFLEEYNDEEIAKGTMDFSLQLSFQGKTSIDRWESSTGNIRFNGSNITLYGFSIDKIADKYKRSQKFNLVDVGALFLAGPVGIAVTKGGDFASLLMTNPGDSSLVHDFVSNWEIRAGVMRAADVAFSTDNNRIAMKGEIDIWQQEFVDLNFAIVNPHGCPVFQQNLNGPFETPEVGNVRVVKTLLGPIRNIFTGKKCKEAFYEGSVKTVEKVK